MSDAIVIKGVTKAFGTKVAVRNLDLVVPAGSLCGFIGPNGAGKTTTIRMIMSIIFPDSGELSILGKTSAVESKDRIGYLPEERGIYRKMKVAAFLAYIAKLKGVDSHAASARARAWLDKVGLGDVGKKKCEELSKGMQQKVQFIAAVIHEPELLILDEVFSGLDPQNRRLMRSLIDEQHQRGSTIVFSTHAMYEAEQLCSRVFMIHKGNKALDMEIGDLWSRYDPRTVIVEPLDVLRAINAHDFVVPGVEIATPSEGRVECRLNEGVDPSQVMAALASRGGIRSVALKRPSLEDIFIKIVGGDAAALLGEGSGGEGSDDESADSDQSPMLVGGAR